MSRLRWRAGRERLHEVIAWLDVRCAELGLESALCARLAVVLEDVASNLALHSGPFTNVEIVLAAEPGAVELRVEDDGVAFDPLAFPEPELAEDLGARRVGGLGIRLFRSLMDEVGYARRNERNQLVLRKRR